MEAQSFWALAGVLVGVLFSSLVTFGLQRREESMRLRAARRLVASDLHKVRALLNDVRDSGAWSTERTRLPTDAYQVHSLTLAQHLPAREWKYLEGMFLGVLHLELIRKETQEDGRPLSPEDLGHIARIGSYIDAHINEFDIESSDIDRSDGYQDTVWKK